MIFDVAGYLYRAYGLRDKPDRETSPEELDAQLSAIRRMLVTTALTVVVLVVVVTVFSWIG